MVIAGVPTRRLLRLARRNFLFFLSRKIGYPLVPADCLQINFTFRCNLRCAMCHMYERSLSFQAQGKPQELKLPVIKKVIKEAGGMGVRSLILIGGEPF
ncbi:MAG: radical SAM protein, partial [Candidatus Omnitrophica bacterium]|nr:radical SAM protein [Candidatus Omnitrophota bacterium]